ncbi:1,4-alpha-glucan branching protein [Streptomyces sp. NPDC001728]|uniref:maltokinase N-terminal cap-like domain-containing protein n=1 Tax=Streptomyces sp. NPDC001728 TaxID=3154396 RepID=UPI00331A2479
MAVIHHTTLRPTKLELLTEWLPTREWYAGTEPRPAKAGGFRLDDPAGEVGIEFMAVTDADGAAYLVPMTYRAGPLAGAEHALIGTCEHGVLGKRWIYDGAHDPVLVDRLYALLAGRTQAQAQSQTDTRDLTVTVSPAGRGSEGEAELVGAEDDREGTDVGVRVAGTRLTLRLHRTLTSSPTATPGSDVATRLTAEWLLPDGTTARGTYVVVLGEDG